MISAIRQKNFAQAKDLLRNKYNPNETDEDGITALMYSIIYTDDPDFIETLIKNGADIDSEDNLKRTAIIWAAAYNKTDIVIKLLEKEAKSDIFSIAWSILYNNEIVVEKLIPKSHIDQEEKRYLAYFAIMIGRQNMANLIYKLSYFDSFKIKVIARTVRLYILNFSSKTKLESLKSRLKDNLKKEINQPDINQDTKKTYSMLINILEDLNVYQALLLLQNFYKGQFDPK